MIFFAFNTSRSARLGGHTLVPSVRGDIDSLIDFRGDLQGVLRAISALAEEIATFMKGHVIVEHEEVVHAPACGVVVHTGTVSHLGEVLDGNPEEAVPLIRHQVDLGFKGRGPPAVCVAIGSGVILHAPWVAQLEESCAIGELLGADDGVGVATSEADFVVDEVVVAVGARGDDVVTVIVLDDKVPEVINTSVAAPFVLPGSAVQGADGICRPSRFSVKIVAPVLSECFLKDGSPEGTVVTSMSEDGTA